MKKLAIWLSVAVVAVLMNGCNGTGSSDTSLPGKSTSGNENGLSEIKKKNEKDNTAPIVYAGRDKRAHEGDRINVRVMEIPDKDGDRVNYYWTLLKKPTGSQAELSRRFGKGTSIDIDLFGKYSLLVMGDDGEDKGFDVINVTTWLTAEDFRLILDEGSSSVSGNWRELSNTNDDDALIEFVSQTGSGTFDVDGDFISFTADQNTELPVTAHYKVYNNEDNVEIAVTVEEAPKVVERTFTPAENGCADVDQWIFDFSGGDLVVDTLSEYPGTPGQIDLGAPGLMPVDLYIYLFKKDMQGNWVYVIRNDDSYLTFNDGSIHHYDSYLSLSNLGPGEYMLSISNYALSVNDALSGCNTHIYYPHGGPYRITFNRPLHFISVPDDNTGGS
jgi:hypothetical protein